MAVATRELSTTKVGLVLACFLSTTSFFFVLCDTHQFKTEPASARIPVWHD
jgi:hypothetical protein